MVKRNAIGFVESANNCNSQHKLLGSTRNGYQAFSKAAVDSARIASGIALNAPHSL
jgi:hypothetical protein